MDSTLFKLLKELVAEFLTKKDEFLKGWNISGYLKIGSHPTEGSRRDSNKRTNQTGTYCDINGLQQQMNYFLQDFISARKIKDYVVSNNLWHLDDLPEPNTIKFPSITSSVSGGFLSRIFELNNGQFNSNEACFNKAYQELSAFLGKDHIDYELYLNLKGVKGDIPEIKLDSQISIIQANFELAKIFCINYSRNDMQGILSGKEVYEGDYLLKAKVKIPKEKYNSTKWSKSQNIYKFQESIKNKWRTLPILAIPGYVNVTKEIILSTDWPIISISAPGPYGDETIYRDYQKGFSINEESISNLKNALIAIQDLDFTDLDKKILYSIERLKKSKSANNIDDRIIELSIAFEYLINTTKSDVTLQLCLKVIKLIDDNNQDEHIFRNLKKFYGLRSDIIHGNTKIEVTSANNEVINFAELIIQKATIRLIELNKKYKYSVIDKALIKSLHVSRPLEELILEASKD